MKKILSVFLAVIMLLSAMAVGVSAADFKDTKSHWGAEYINYWTAENAVNGYQDGSFRPDNSVTRGEVAQIIVKILNLLPTSTTNPFKDMPVDAWYFNAILACYDHGIIAGFPDKTVRANEPITREQAFVMISRITNVTPNAAAAGNFVDGKQASSWAAGAIGALVGAGVLDGYKTAAGVEIRPQNNVTRAEFLKLFATVDKASNIGYKVGTRKAAETEEPDQPIIIPAFVASTTPSTQYYKADLTIKAGENTVELDVSTKAIGEASVLADIYTAAESKRKADDEIQNTFGLDIRELSIKIAEKYSTDKSALNKAYLEGLNISDITLKKADSVVDLDEFISATYKSLVGYTYTLTFKYMGIDYTATLNVAKA